jgi:hypothetical protein
MQSSWFITRLILVSSLPSVFAVRGSVVPCTRRLVTREVVLEASREPGQLKSRVAPFNALQRGLRLGRDATDIQGIREA